MITRRVFWLLVPFCAAGGMLLRGVEKAKALPVIPKTWRGTYIKYLWTDGQGNIYHSGYDVPADATDVQAHNIFPER